MGCGLSKAHSNPEVLVSHGSARLTVHGRRLIVLRHRAGWKQAHIAAAMGVSRKCVKNWIERHAAEGEDGLRDRSSRPHSMPTKTCSEVEAQVVELRSSERRGQDWIGAELGLAPRTVARILRRHHLPYLRHCDPMTGEVIKASKATAVRYERERPGELVHMDVKKLGKIPEGGGWRARGQTTRNHQARIDRKPIGYDYVHSLIDDHSRLAYSEIHDDEKAETCARFFQRALEYFANHGINHVERLMTDNAFAYRHGSALRDICITHRIKQVFIRPHCPWQNGKVERLNRTLTSEWAYRQPFLTNADRIAALAPWIEHYNTDRRHSALGGLPPISRLLPT
jgi:transposase InsO family protein